MVYAKMPFCMRYLEHYLCTDVFDKTMQGFYTEWKFKHPQPEDLRASFNKTAWNSIGFSMACFVLPGSWTIK